MDRGIDETLHRAAEALAATGSVAGTGFWGAVSRVKADPGLVAVYAERIAELDRAAFLRWARVRVPLGAGTALMVAGTIVGLVLQAAAYRLAAPLDAVALLVGTAVLLVTTHGLGHLVVGRLCGIRFIGWFVGPRRPQPGVKVDYASYLRASPTCRAWMHAAGAIVTKLVPVVALGVGWAAGVAGWAMAVLGVVAVVQLVTDAVLSTRSGDWAKFRRELRYAGR